MLVNFANLLGIAVCLLIAMQAVVFLCRSLFVMRSDRRMDRLRILKLNTEIEMLRQRHHAQGESKQGWAGFRKFRVDRLVAEADNTRSIYLVPHDGKTLPSFHPGQYLTFQLRVPGEEKPIVRCYSLSDAPGRPYYRCTVKQVPPPPQRPELPPGKSSTYMNEVLQPGDILDVKSPRGAFYLDLEDTRPVVLLAGGVGITPMVSMLNAVCVAGSGRPVILFYGVNHSRDHVFKQELAALCANHSNVQQVVCYSDPLETDVQGRDYDVRGWVSIDLLKNSLSSRDYNFFLCGPPPFMNSLVNGLEEWGVPAEAVHTEAFGPASVKKSKRQPTTTTDEEQIAVGFDRSKKVVRWDPNYDSLLDFAEAQGIEVESGCRAGNCGTCAIAVKSGKVRYSEDDHMECEKGTCLPCVCTPDGALVLDV